MALLQRTNSESRYQTLGRRLRLPRLERLRQASVGAVGWTVGLLVLGYVLAVAALGVVAR